VKQLQIKITGTTLMGFVLGCLLAGLWSWGLGLRADMKRIESATPPTVHEHAAAGLADGKLEMVKALIPALERAGMDVVKDCRLLDELPPPRQKKGEVRIRVAERLEREDNSIYRINCQKMAIFTDK